MDLYCYSFYYLLDNSDLKNDRKDLSKIKIGGIDKYDSKKSKRSKIWREIAFRKY